MTEALEAADREVPKYLETLKATTNPASLGKAAFAMACFWTGEYELGKIDGVVATEAGWLEGREVTYVHFDKDKIDTKQLVQEAAKVKCAQKVYLPDGKAVAALPTGRLTSAYRTAKQADQKRQIARWYALRKVPALNPMQLSKLNAFAPRDREQALSWLSPRQRAMLEANSGAAPTNR